MDLSSAFRITVARSPAAEAVVDGSLRRTYAQWEGDIRAVAGGLARLGLREGDHLLLVLKNRIEMATLYWACHALGVIFTPINWRSSAADIGYCLENSGATAVAFEGVSEAAAREAVGQHPVHLIAVADAGSDGATAFSTLIDGPAIPAMPSRDADSICMMLYTSGTTGRPKGVPRSHANELAASISQIAHNRYVFGDSAIGVMPLYHTMGVRVLLAAALLNGRFVCLPTYDPEQLMTLVERERISTMFLVPTLYFDILRHPRFKSFDRSSLTKIGYAGMTMTDALTEEVLAEFRPDLFVNYYGSSEIYTFAFCDHLHQKPGCAGRAGLNQQIRVVRADTAATAGPDDVVPAGTPGEIIASLQSPEAFKGYWHRPDADAKALRGGWYFTGDLGAFDDDGELFVLGRVDDMIICGGENIHAEEVENALVRCDLVSSVAVVGVADDRMGQKVVAFVEPASPDVTPESLDRFCAESGLARFKRPREYILVEEIPRSAVGKILRRELRAGHYRPWTAAR